MHALYIVMMVALSFVPVALAGTPAVPITNPQAEAFKAYWYPNGAELSRFALRQARYGEYHDGDAVLVFVTESLNRDTQIKADRFDARNIPVLKLNAVRKFYTGIYPYSVMTSVFTPVGANQQARLPLKISTSVQEWCGHVFMQLNLDDQGYRYGLRSYFESDGDRDDRLGRVITEDALWNMIRIAPADLPRGALEILPGTVFLRMAHRPPQPLAAQARLRSAERPGKNGQPLLQYEVDLPSVARRLTIWFEQAFPHRIEAWEEHGRLRTGALMVTRAERTHLMMLDYWNHHQNRDRQLLPRLGLASAD